MLTRQAFACFVDDVALLACTALPGIEPATASVLLTAQAPDRYVVIDSRALGSLRALGRLPGGSHFDATDDWEPYLDACRRLADDADADLTTVYRALVSADGVVEPPTACPVAIEPPQAAPRRAGDVPGRPS